MQNAIDNKYIFQSLQFIEKIQHFFQFILPNKTGHFSRNFLVPSTFAMSMQSETAPR